MRQYPRRSSAVVAAAAFAAAVPAAVAPAAHAEESAPELTVSTLPTASPKPGELYDQQVTVTNHGTAPADGVTFRIRLTRGLDFPEQAGNCTYSTVGDQVRQALCELDTVVEPGATLTVPVRFKALPHALMEAVEYGTTATGEAPGTGFSEAYRRLTLKADSWADLVAVGEETEGLAGDGQSVTLELRNDGPGWIQNQVSDDLPGLVVTIPPGTTTTQVPKDCSPFHIDGPTGGPLLGRAQYVCWPKDDATLDVGEKHLYTFSLKIDKDAVDPKGKVRASSVYNITPAYDRNLANNTAPIVIDTPSDYEPEPSPTPSTPAPTTPGDGGNDPDGQGGAATPSPSAPAGTTGSTGTTGTTGNLASTGTDGTGLLAGAAAAAAALGALLVLTVRRMRNTTR
ncbi:MULTISPECIES: hypothetical protein [Streptomyces]|uniref:DUF11 domain-containing protein n=1 Tax=Streptomyces fuscus TaxID=3048495 RepID=A0ABT7J6V3_9ACTN|nr:MULTISPECIES: hypothetical protein [Streptomyces]MCM1969885.1 hypothetical protein [Streptomyces sp. G1]MDL2080589.1 hypothetical protein [Streptomyces fuscus]SBT94329.1 hypothetical protein GA0115233_108519 [Streptomyces sp. DI166]